MPVGSVPAVFLWMRRIGRKESWRVVGSEFYEGNRQPDLSVWEEDTSRHGQEGEVLVANHGLS